MSTRRKVTQDEAGLICLGSLIIACFGIVGVLWGVDALGIIQLQGTVP